MTPEQKAAYVIAQSACMNARMESMKAANTQATFHGQPPLYQEWDFISLPDEFGLHHNAICLFFQE